MLGPDDLHVLLSAGFFVAAVALAVYFDWCDTREKEKARRGQADLQERET